MFHIIGHMFFGLIVGIVAKVLMPGHDPSGFLVTILLGIAGAWVGGQLGRLLGWYEAGHPAGFVMAVIGAIVLLFIYRLTISSPPPHVQYLSPSYPYTIVAAATGDPLPTASARRC
jgi:uncharacterized membrane protein YeaQ/YmgE (transglycosylase-associated protein family)